VGGRWPSVIDPTAHAGFSPPEGAASGVITLGVLQSLELELAEATGRGGEFPLGDFFDLVGRH
jgi:hypothetical protein